MGQDDLPRAAQVWVSIASPQSELVEIASVFTNIVRRDTADFRQELENLVNSFAESAPSHTKPVITEREIPSIGGGLGTSGMAFAVGVSTGLVTNSLYDLLKMLASRFAWSGGEPPNREQFLMENANALALGTIEQSFGVIRDQLKPVIADIQGPNAHLVYHAEDGAIFTVRMEKTGKATVTGITKNWPTTQRLDES